MRVHGPVVAGRFYPGDPDTLRATVGRLVAAAPPHDGDPPKALILPHAGYRFSGAAAAAGIASLSAGARRVVVLGPSHHHSFRGVAVPDADALMTPLGPVPLDRAAIADLLQDPDVATVPEAFALEHSIEVELPFLQHRLGEITLVPLVVGQIAPARLAALVDRLWGGDETLIVISTDLTHFLTADEATRIDAATAHAIETMDPAGLTGREACGHRPLAAFLACARQRGMRLTRLALTHSGQITGDGGRVVGYGAWMAHLPDRAALSQRLRTEALRIARQTLLSRARRGKTPAINLASFGHPLRGIAPAFVTLTVGGRLRGCIGSLRGHRPLAEDILHNAVRAGFEDPRFRPVTEAEMDRIHIEIAVLGPPAAMASRTEDELLAQLRPGRDGLILQSAGKRGTFLPKVWEALPTPAAFLSALKVKAGLDRDHWADDVQVWRYTSEVFSEKPETDP